MAKVVPIRKAAVADHNGRYILKGRQPFPEPDLFKWGLQFQNSDRVVAQTKITRKITVSTVFLGLDHRWGDGAPLLFETMIFGGKHDGFLLRYPTWEKAERGHKRACVIARRRK